MISFWIDYIPCVEFQAHIYHGFFTGITMYVAIANVISPHKEFNFGILLGSVLGPILLGFYSQTLSDVFLPYFFSHQAFSDGSKLQLTCTHRNVHNAISTFLAYKI